MIGCTRQHLTLIHTVHVSEVFVTKYFLRNGCTFEEKGRAWERGPDNPDARVTFKMVVIIYI